LWNAVTAHCILVFIHESCHPHILQWHFTTTIIITVNS
jgi:hypothetical protein